MTRRLIFDDGAVKVYEWTDERGLLIGTDREPSVTPAPSPSDQIEARLSRAEAKFEALKAVPEIAAKVNLDTVNADRDQSQETTP